MPETLAPPASRSATPRPANDLIDFLDASHIALRERLQRLQALAERIAEDGIGPAERHESADLVAWFDAHARQHHLDEEKHVFPSLLVSADAAVVETTRHLLQDHGWLEEDWLMIEPSLRAAADGNHWFDPHELLHAVGVFRELYHDHMRLEESLAYPQARQRLDSALAQAAGIEMARRRAARIARGG